MSVSKAPAALGLLLLCAAVAVAEEATPIEPAALLQKLEGSDAQHMVEKLNDRQWNVILENIETGEKPWLDVAVSLHRRTDAGQSEMVTLAVGNALVKNPDGILRTAIGEMSVESVCGYPDMSDHRTDSQGKVVAYLDARIQALRKVDAKEVSGRREKCLETLQTVRRQVMSPSGPFGQRPR
jgi:hypothetical protein